MTERQDYLNVKAKVAAGIYSLIPDPVWVQKYIRLNAGTLAPTPQFWWACEEVREHYNIASGKDGAEAMAAKMREVTELHAAILCPARLKG